MLNRAEIIGRLTRDPELRYTPTGKPVAQMAIATNADLGKDENGERRETVEYHDVVMWGTTAETTARYLSKGRLVFVEGRLQTHSWKLEGITSPAAAPRSWPRGSSSSTRRRPALSSPAHSSSAPSPTPGTKSPSSRSSGGGQERRPALHLEPLATAAGGSLHAGGYSGGIPPTARQHLRDVDP